MAGWLSLIHMQRERRIVCEIRRIEREITDYYRHDDGFHVDRLLDELAGWRGRTVTDESQWTVAA